MMGQKQRRQTPTVKHEKKEASLSGSYSRDTELLSCIFTRTLVLSLCG